MGQNMMTHYTEFTHNPPSIPLDGGNLFTNAQYLKALESGFREIWLLYIQEQKYYTNLFSIEGDKMWEKVAPLFATTLFNYGYCAVKKIGDRYAVLTILNKKTHIDGTFKSGTGIITTSFNDTNYTDDKASKRTKIKLTDKNCVFCKFNDYGFPAFMWLAPWLYVSNEIIHTIKVGIKSINAKLGYETETPDSPIVRRNVSSMMDTKTYMSIIQKNKKRGAEDEIKEFKTAAPDGAIRGIETLEQWENWFGSKYGKRENTAFKKERNLTDEVELESAKFNIIEKEMYKYLKLATDGMNELFGLSLKLVYNQEDQNDEERGDDNDPKGANE